MIDLSAQTAASNIRIWNDAKRPINVQARIYRWSQSNGADTYAEATDVVASPPISQLKPGSENIVRIVRTSKSPVKAEESYRLIVDELPYIAQRRSGTLNPLQFEVHLCRRRLAGKSIIRAFCAP
ncbi:molecular chaperone [Ochrobactrum teleogrylli]|uniref:fimbrial biogenesis chaperone n=1 Tax=Ochrobactrum teleogrylli TaxID=2479765 RepID=UPI00384C3E6D